jgi:hypothetical protein
MIKLKNILREAGLLGEQVNQTQVLNVALGTTQQQLRQQLDDSGFDLTNPVTIKLTFSSQLPDNHVPKPNQITQLQTTLAAINAIGQDISAAVNASTTNTSATGTGAPVSQFTQGGAAFAKAFPNVAQAYPVTNNETSNNFLLLNRAGAVYQAAISAGIQNITTTIPTDGTATSQQTKFVTLSVTAIVNQPIIGADSFARYLVVQPRPGDPDKKYYNIVIPSNGYPNAVDFMSPELAQRFITTHPHRTEIDKSTLLDFLRETNKNKWIRVNLIAYPKYTVIVTNYDKELPRGGNKLYDWVTSNKLHQKPGANLFK